MPGVNDFDFVVDRIDSPRGQSDFYNLKKLEVEDGGDLTRLPYSIRIILENAVRNAKNVEGAGESAHKLLEWPRSISSGFPFMPSRVLLQDYTGVPLVVDLAAMRDAMRRSGRDPRVINSLVSMDLIIDHSVQVDGWS